MSNSTKININISGNHFSIENDELEPETVFKDLVSNKKSFVIETHNMRATVKEVENIIEGLGYKCRTHISTRDRLHILGVFSILSIIDNILSYFFPDIKHFHRGSYVNLGIMMSYLCFIGIHYWATYNADFSITKDYLNKKVTVIYKKSTATDINEI